MDGVAAHSIQIGVKGKTCKARLNPSIPCTNGSFGFVMSEAGFSRFLAFPPGFRSGIMFQRTLLPACLPSLNKLCELFQFSDVLEDVGSLLQQLVAIFCERLLSGDVDISEDIHLLHRLLEVHTGCAAVTKDVIVLPSQVFYAFLVPQLPGTTVFDTGLL